MRAAGDECAHASFRYAMAEAQRREMRELLASQTKWVLVHATSAYKYTLPPSRQRRGRCVASGL